jgi:DNA-binding LacI/PurR family transcriptional regulator
MIFNSKRSSELEEKYLHLSISNRVDGILSFSLGQSKKTINTIIKKNRIPVIVLDEYYEGLNADFINHDVFKGSYILIDHLVKVHNHKKIACIDAKFHESWIGSLRFEGYKQALKDNNIEFDEKLIITCETPEESYSLVKSLFEQNKELKALYSTSTYIGIGAILALKDLGLKLGEDVAFVTFDELDMNKYCTPSLTSVKEVVNEFSKFAADIIMERINNTIIKDTQNIIIPAEIVIRESCGCKGNSVFK